MEIQFSGTLDEPLVAQAVQLASQPTRVQRTLRIIMILVIVAAVVFVSYSTITGTETQPTRWLRIPLWLGLLAYFLYQPVLTRRRLTHRIWQSVQSNPKMEGEVTPQGISFTLGGDHQEILWEQFFRLRRSDDMTILLAKNGLLSMFPRRFFSHPSDWTRLHQYIDQRVKDRK